MGKAARADAAGIDHPDPAVRMLQRRHVQNSDGIDAIVTVIGVLAAIGLALAALLFFAIPLFLPTFLFLVWSRYRDSAPAIETLHWVILSVIALANLAGLIWIWRKAPDWAVGALGAVVGFQQGIVLTGIVLDVTSSNSDTPTLSWRLLFVASGAAIGAAMFFIFRSAARTRR